MLVSSESSSTRSSFAMARSPDETARLESLYARIEEVFLLKTRSDEVELEARGEICFEAAWKALLDGDIPLIRGALPQLCKIRDSRGRSLLRCCVERGEIACLRRLEERGFARDLRDSDRGLLQAAARTEDTEVMGWLLNNGLGLLDGTHEGLTALHAAIEVGAEASVHYLLEQNASLHKSCDYEGLMLTPLALSVLKGSQGCMEKLLAKGANVKQRIEGVGTLLHLAVRSNQTEILEALLAFHGGDELIDEADEKRGTALCLAAYLGDIEAIQCLVKRNASFRASGGRDRTPVHWAVLGDQLEAVKWLSYLGAPVDEPDGDHIRPLNLADKDSIMWNVLANFERADAAEKKAPPDFSKRPPQNIVSQGGGAAGCVYIGVVRALEEAGWLEEYIKRVGGTSAGAITSTLLAINCSAKRIEQLIREKPLTMFLDYRFSSKKILDAIGNYSEIRMLYDVYKFATDPVGSMKDFAHKVLDKLWHCTGVCEGEVFRKWIEKEIRKQTRKEYCTFGELRRLIRERKGLKHLHMFAQRIGAKPKITRFSSEDERWDRLIISDACRCSMSLPGIFSAHILHFKDEEGRRFPRPDLGSYVDGGMLMNFPLDAFDRLRYVEAGVTDAEANQPAFNRRTLGFSLFQPLKEESLVTPKVETVGELLVSMYYVYRQAQDLIAETNPYRRHRVVKIDRKGIGTTEFDMPPKKFDAAVKSAYETTKAFIGESESSLKKSEFVRPDRFRSSRSEKRETLVSRSNYGRFMGRKTERMALKRALNPATLMRADPVRVRVLVGESGIGKGELIRTFIHSHRSKFSHVIWIDAGSSEAQLVMLHRLAALLKIKPKRGAASTERLREELHQRLEAGPFDKPWLMVFLHAQGMPPYPSKGGAVLITSERSDLWADGVTRVNGLSLDDAATLVSHRTHDVADGSDLTLHEQLGHHTFTLDVVATSIGRREIKVNEYLEEIGLHARQPEALHALLNQLEREYPLAADWLSVCAHLSPTEIPVEWLASWCTARLDSELEARVEAKQILKTLGEWALIRWEVKDHTFLMPRYLQRVLRKPAHAGEALELLDGVRKNLTEETDRRDWMVHAARLTHQARLGTSLQSALLYKEIAETLQTMGALDEAIPYYRGALERLEHLHDFDQDVGSVSRRLGMALIETGSRDRAIEHLERAYGIVMSGDDPDREKADLGYQLGCTYLDEARASDALDPLRNALHLREGLDEASMDLINAYEALGRAQTLTSDAASAVENYRAALDIRRTLSSPLEIASSLAELSELSKGLGRTVDARMYAAEEVSARERNVSAAHRVKLADAYFRLAELEEEDNRREAIRLYKAALGLYEEQSAGHPRIPRINARLKSIEPGCIMQ